MRPHLWHKALLVALLAPLLSAQEVDFQVYTEAPRLLLNARRLRLLKRERERESMRWQQFDGLMKGKAAMAEPGFALALYGTVTGRAEPCREAAEWALKAADFRKNSDIRQAALVYDWCAAQVPESQSGMLSRKLSATLAEKPADASGVRSRVFAALAILDSETNAAQAYVKWSVENWWKQSIQPKLQKAENPFQEKAELYAMTEFLHAIRDNLRADMREGAGEWFEELAPMQLLGYYPQPWPAPENEYHIPAYIGRGEPSIQEAVLSRAAEMAMVAYDANAQPLQFLQGWVMQDRFLMRGTLGITYEFLWANPYQPGLSYTYMPDLFHARGQIFTRSSWEDDATWFGYWNSQAQTFQKGQRIAVRLDAKPGPVDLGPVRVFFASAGMRFECGWTPPPEEGAKRVEEVAFLVGLSPNTRYDVEVDDEEMFETRTDSGGILELRFLPGRKAGVRIKKSTL